MNIQEAVKRRLATIPEPAPWAQADLRRRAQDEKCIKARAWFRNHLIESEQIEIEPSELEMIPDSHEDNCGVMYRLSGGFVTAKIQFGQSEQEPEFWIDGAYHAQRAWHDRAAFVRFVDAVIYVTGAGSSGVPSADRSWLGWLKGNGNNG